MLRMPKERLAIFLVLVLCQGVQGSRPVLSPEDPEIYVDEGQSLNLTCTSDGDRIEFHFPDSYGPSFFQITSAMTEIYVYVGISRRTTVYRRPNTGPGDTGWYGCSNYGDKINFGNYTDPRGSWTYVYVKSNTSYFTNNNEIRALSAVLGTTVTIPCRPTSPDHKVILTVSDKVIEMGARASYDPKIGFTLKNVTLEDNGYVTCSISEGNATQVRFVLRVSTPESMMSHPTIVNADSPRHAVRGQTLHVNCTAVAEYGAHYSFNWTTPRQSSKITTRQYSSFFATNKQLLTCELIIDDVTYEDAGDYTCSIMTYDVSKSTTMHVLIHDPAV